MFGMSLPEIAVVMMLALIVFGPKKLPELARSIGKGVAELKQASQEMRDQIDREIINRP